MSQKNIEVLLKSIFLCTGLLFLESNSFGQNTGITRTELQRNDLGIPGIEANQMRISFEPGAAFGKHSHPGEEIIYVLEGSLEYEVEGKPLVTLKAGEVLFIPAGKIHAARNVGKVKATELATYIVKKGETLVKMER
jgi:quercetin dioxygenase-like cupin family protein